MEQIQAFQGQLKMTELKLRDAEAALADKERDISEVRMRRGERRRRPTYAQQDTWARAHINE